MKVHSTVDPGISAVKGTLVSASSSNHGSAPPASGCVGYSVAAATTMDFGSVNIQNNEDPIDQIIDAVVNNQKTMDIEQHSARFASRCEEESVATAKLIDIAPENVQNKEAPMDQIIDAVVNNQKTIDNEQTSSLTACVEDRAASMDFGPENVQNQMNQIIDAVVNTQVMMPSAQMPIQSASRCAKKSSSAAAAQTDLRDRPSSSKDSKKKCPTPGCSGQGSTNIYAKSHRAIRYCPNKGNSVASLLINQKEDEEFSEVEDDEISSDDAENKQKLKNIFLKANLQVPKESVNLQSELKFKNSKVF